MRQRHDRLSLRCFNLLETGRPCRTPLVTLCRIIGITGQRRDELMVKFKLVRLNFKGYAYGVHQMTHDDDPIPWRCTPGTALMCSKTQGGVST